MHDFMHLVSEPITDPDGFNLQVRATGGKSVHGKEFSWRIKEKVDACINNVTAKYFN